MRHRFYPLGNGIDRCACGTERELRQELNPPRRLYWWYRIAAPASWRWAGFRGTNLVEANARHLWPCPVAMERTA